MRRYSYIFFCAAIIWSMVGCAKSDVEAEIVGSSDQLIAFATSVEKTRASLTTDESLLGDKIKVATFKDNDAKSHYFTDEIEHKNSVWTSGRKRYWPVGDNLNFLAYSPLGKSFIEEEGVGDYANYSLRYKCPAQIDDQIDLLVKTITGCSADPDNDGIDDAVPLKFNHALSGIKFNVEFKDENSVRLDSIAINYVGIENERVYNFATASWEAPLKKHFDSKSGSTTWIKHGKSLTKPSDSNIKFTDIDKYLMIIPQKIDEDNKHFISIQIYYTLLDSNGQSVADVITGTVPLPAPDESNLYAQGYIYKYNIIVRGEKIEMDFTDVDIADQERPVPAYGNIDLDLIKAPLTANGTIPNDGEDAEYYYATAQRVKELLLGGVRDFVVVGSLDADKDTDGDGNIDHLGNGKLGFYGAASSPFTIGANWAKAESGNDYTFSIDLRGTYKYPEFQYANDEGGDTATTTSNEIQPTDPIMIAGIFSDVKRLTEIKLPHGLMAIGTHSFADCDGLTTIDIADVKHIEAGGFQHSAALQTVKNGNLTRIHNNGFVGCTSLTTIDLSGVTQIGPSAFANCENLTNVDLSNLDIIGEHAFNGCHELTLNEEVDIPSFTSVADYAFSECRQLGVHGKHIDLRTATHIGDHAFNECTQIKISKGKVTLDANGDVLTDDDGSTDNIAHLDLLDVVEEYAFKQCEWIGKDLDGTTYDVSMPIISSIGEFAFMDCTALNIIDGLENLSTISESAFQGCSMLKGYSGDSGVLKLSSATSVGVSAFHSSGVTNVEFDKTKLTTIGASAFQDSKSLTTITGLDGVTSVGAYAFSECSSLESLELPDVGTCGADFIYHCYALKTLKLGVTDFTYVNPYDDKVTPISSQLRDWGATHHNSTLEYVELPNVTELPSGSFNDFVALETLILSGVEGTFGGWQYFITNTRLKYIDLSSVETMNAQSFVDCTSAVESIDLRNATTINDGAFANCTALKKLNISSFVPISEQNYNWTFEGFPAGQCDLWLPASEKDNVNGKVWGSVTWANIYIKGEPGYVEFSLK